MVAQAYLDLCAAFSFRTFVSHENLILLLRTPSFIILEEFFF